MNANLNGGLLFHKVNLLNHHEMMINSLYSTDYKKFMRLFERLQSLYKDSARIAIKAYKDEVHIAKDVPGHQINQVFDVGKKAQRLGPVGKIAAAGLIAVGLGGLANKLIEHSQAPSDIASKDK